MKKILGGILAALVLIPAGAWAQNTPCTGVIEMSLPDVQIYGTYNPADSTFTVLVPEEVTGRGGADFAIPVYWTSSVAVMNGVQIVYEYDDTMFEFVGVYADDSTVMGAGYYETISTARDSTVYVALDSLNTAPYDSTYFVSTRTCLLIVDTSPEVPLSCSVTDSVTTRIQPHKVGNVMVQWSCPFDGEGFGGEDPVPTDQILYYLLFNTEGEVTGLNSPYESRKWPFWDQAASFSVACSRTDQEGKEISWMSGYNYNEDNKCRTRLGDYQWQNDNGCFVFDKKGEEFGVADARSAGVAWCDSTAVGRTCIPCPGCAKGATCWNPKYCPVDTECDYTEP